MKCRMGTELTPSLSLSLSLWRAALLLHKDIHIKEVLIRIILFM
jgi:hypothetical protein